MEMELVGKLFLIVFLVVANAFFVGSEIALTSARRSRIKQLASTGNKSARMVQVLHDEPERFYSVTQIGTRRWNHFSRSFPNSLTRVIVTAG